MIKLIKKGFEIIMKSRLIVAAVIEKDGRVLLGRKAVDVGPYPNTWLIPGGGVNLGEESLDEGIAREVKEETGLEIKKIEKLSFDEDREANKYGEITHYVFLVFKIIPVSDNAVAGDDLSVVQWFTKFELKDIPHSKPTQKLFKQIGWI